MCRECPQTESLSAALQQRKLCFGECQKRRKLPVATMFTGAKWCKWRVIEKKRVRSWCCKSLTTVIRGRNICTGSLIQPLQCLKYKSFYVSNRHTSILINFHAIHYSTVNTVNSGFWSENSLSNDSMNQPWSKFRWQKYLPIGKWYLKIISYSYWNNFHVKVFR